MWRVGGAPLGRLFGLRIGLLGLTGCSNPGYFVCTVGSECTEAEDSSMGSRSSDSSSGTESVLELDRRRAPPAGSLGQPALCFHPV